MVTTWDWGPPKQYLHDLIASDRRFPTVNAYGPLFGSPEYSTDAWPILDPVKHTVTYFKAPVRDANTTVALGPGHAASDRQVAPSPYWGTELIWDTKTNNHNGMFDRHGRVWFAARGRERQKSRLLQEGLGPSVGQGVPGAEHRIGSYRCSIPKTMKYTFIDTCFQTHHLQFGYDKNDTLWTSSGGGTGVVGWLNLKM